MSIYRRSKRFFYLGFILSICSFQVLAVEDLFPHPEAITPDVNFWQKVYTEINTDQGYIHDDQYLNVIYQVVQLEPNLSRKRRNKVVKKYKKQYKSVLLSLAKGKRKNLTAAEQRVLNLWPENVSNKELRNAAKRLRFQLGQSNKFKEGLIRSGKWKDYIEKTFTDMELPVELSVLPHVESSFNPTAYSHVGAAGMWQFTRSTGRRYMRIDHIIDERLDPFIASKSAARLLQHNYSIVGTWPLALTAYNHGVSGMRRASKKLGGTDIVPILRKYKGRTFGFASRNFYVAFLAALYVNRNHEEYFGKVEFDQPDNLTLVKTKKFLSIKDISKALKVNLTTLQKFNPALSAAVWQGAKYVPKGYELRIPDYSGPNAAELALANINAANQFSRQKPDTYYRVRRGDSLSTIAERYGTSMRKLAALNGLRNYNRIRIGQKLRLPQGKSKSIKQEPWALPEDGFYTVRRGDTVSLIARRFNVPENNLIVLNELSNRNAIHIGQRLKVIGDVDAKPETIQTAKTESQVDKQSVTLAANKSAILEVSSLTVDQIESAEPTSEIEAADIAPAQPPGLHPVLSADPSDYAVSERNTIIVQGVETLGHYADWLEIPTRRLRILNRLKYGQPVVVGKRIKLDFSVTSAEAFEQRRIIYHRELQESYFQRYRIIGSQEHTIRRGDSIWVLAQRKFNVPMWLLLQYNPNLNLQRIQPGDRIVFPQVELKS